ncbi:MAG: STAS domain-containing protein [Verrucomicrobiota bacterium]
MGSGNNQDNLTAAYIGRTAVVRVNGRGSFKISPPMKQFIQRVIATNSANRILLDMSECCGMDSTFMGVLAGLSYHVKDKPGFTLKLINLSEKNQKLLTTLGVDQVVDFSLSTTGEEKELMAGQSDGAQALEPDFANTLEAAKTTLEAHEALVEINPENLAKFKSVLELLQEDIRTLDHQ